MASSREEICVIEIDEEETIDHPHQLSFCSRLCSWFPWRRSSEAAPSSWFAPFRFLTAAASWRCRWGETTIVFSWICLRSWNLVVHLFSWGIFFILLFKWSSFSRLYFSALPSNLPHLRTFRYKCNIILLMTRFDTILLWLPHQGGRKERDKKIVRNKLKIVQFHSRMILIFSFSCHSKQVPYFDKRWGKQ